MNTEKIMLTAKERDEFVGRLFDASGETAKKMGRTDEIGRAYLRFLIQDRDENQF